MSVRESEISRSLRQQLRREQRKQQLDALPATLHDAQVLTFRQWAALNALGERTARRLLHNGNGPAVVRLSAKRIGVTVAADRAWKAGRVR